MTPEQLRAALESRASTASPSPGALAEIRGRADRRRWTARLQVGVVGVAVVGIAAGAFALADGRSGLEPAPPATSRSPEPTPEPSVGASAPASPGPSATPTTGSASAGPVGSDEFVAVLQDGRLVVVSASTGRITRTVATFRMADPADSFMWQIDVDLSPDRRTAYVVVPGEPGADECGGGRIRRVDLITGRDEFVVEGTHVDVSPDGTRLAYLTHCGGRGAVVRDLRTGSDRVFRHTESEPGTSGHLEPWGLADLAWHADHRRVWLLLEWENTSHLRLLDPATDRSTADAERMNGPDGASGIEPRGDALVFLRTCCYPEFTEDSTIVLRAPDGREREVVRSPASGRLGEPQAGPDGDLLYTQRGRLYRLDLETGRTSDLGRSTALARDW